MKLAPALPLSIPGHFHRQKNTSISHYRALISGLFRTVNPYFCVINAGEINFLKKYLPGIKK
jgi:hypothetical protein